MGVKGLYTYVKKYRVQRPYESIPSSPKLRIGIDAMSLLYKYKQSYEKMYSFLETMHKDGHTILFVFDGKSPVEKEAEVSDRRQVREEAVKQASVLESHLESTELQESERAILETSIARLKNQAWHMTRDIRQAVQAALTKIGINYIKGVAEADDTILSLSAAGKLDVVMSTDMDYLLSGIPRLWIPYRTTDERGGIEEVLLSKVLAGEKLTAAMLLDAGILCGVEPLYKRLSIQTHVAFSWIKYYKTIEAILQDNEDAQFSVLREKGLLEKVRKHFLPKSPWMQQIRPDHLHRTRVFLDAL
jgi:5'-3' exonuclease